MPSLTQAPCNFSPSPQRSISFRHVESMNTPPPKANIYAAPQSEPPPLRLNRRPLPTRGSVLARVNHINSISRGQSYTPPDITVYHESGLTPRSQTRQRTRSFLGSVASDQKTGLRTPRLAKASSLSSLSTVTTLDLSPGLILDGNAGDMNPLEYSSACMASPDYISKRNKVPGLANYTSSKLSLVRRSIPNLSKATQCTIGRRSSVSENHDIMQCPGPNQVVEIGELLTTDGTRESQKTTTHICHNCQSVLASTDLCHNCGHEFCYKCTETASSNCIPSTDESVDMPAHEDPNQERLFAKRCSNNPQDVQMELNNHDSDEDSVGSNDALESIEDNHTKQSLNKLPLYSQREPAAPLEKPLIRSESIVSSTTNPIMSSTDLNGSCSTGQQPKRHGANHCLCCIAKYPDSRHQPPKPGTSESSFNIYDSNTHDGSVSTGSSPRPHSTTQRQSFIPEALQPYPQEIVTDLGSDPFQDHRLLRPHPHLAEPEVEEWPQLRRVTRPIGKRTEPVTTTIPWRRSALRKVSRRPSSRKPAEEQVNSNEPWVDKLRHVPSTEVQPLQLSSSPPRTPDPPTGNRRDTRVFFDRNRSESSKRGGLLTSHEQRGHPASSHGSGISPLGASYHTINSPKLSVRQVEQLLAQGAGKRERPTSIKTMSKDSTPSTIRSHAQESPSNHSCSWKDRFMDLSVEVDHLRTELASCEESSSETKGSETGSSNDIEGLTVIIHLKGKDDLVVNTDLRYR